MVLAKKYSYYNKMKEIKINRLKKLKKKFNKK